MRPSTNARMLAGTLLIGVLSGCGGATFSAEHDGGGHDASERDGSERHDGGLDARTGDGGQGDAPATHDAPTHADAPVADDASPPWSPVCPTIAPVVGATCANEGVTCEYGLLQYDVACDTVFQCENGAWSKFDTFMPCVPDRPNSATCPSTLANVPQGGACGPTGLSCAYPEGVCSCEMQFGPIIADGGEGATWTCNPGQGCPMPRPRLGSPCTSNTSCTYESCDYGQSCQGGAWQAEEEGCAKAGG
jgi:hypothetical protein